jgi:transposase
MPMRPQPAGVTATCSQVHRAGEKMLVDDSGKRLSIVDPATGESVPVELFVALLGASNDTYAEASAMLVPDQPMSGVSKSCRFEPGVQRTYAEMATHSGAVVVPARPRKPRDKPKSRIIRWAGTIGPQTEALVTAIMENRPHPEQGYRSCLGILRLARRHGETRLEAACTRALRAKALSCRHVESILKHGLDRQPLLPLPEETSAEPRTHENVRGPGYYQ